MSEVAGTEAILEALDGIRRNVERSVDIVGKIKMERPSIRPKFQDPLPPSWAGDNHLRYTIQLDILLPQSLGETANDTK